MTYIEKDHIEIGDEQKARLVIANALIAATGDGASGSAEQIANATVVISKAVLEGHAPLKTGDEFTVIRNPDGTQSVIRP